MRSFDEKTALFRPLLPPTTGHDVRLGPLSTAFATGVAAWAVRRDGGKSRLLKPQFQPSRNAPHYLLHATNGLSKASSRPSLQPPRRRYETPAPVRLAWQDWSGMTQRGRITCCPECDSLSFGH